MKLFAPHATDGYKLGHGGQDPKGLTMKYSNLTPRSNRLFVGATGYDGKMVVFGTQGAWQEIVELWDESFFALPHDKAIARYKRRVDGYVGPDVIPVDKMSALHKLGYLPLSLRALPEGIRIPMKIPVLTLQNTHDDFGWLVNYLETIVSSSMWKSSTNATIAYEYKRLLTSYAIQTGSPVEGVIFQGHDFSARGMSGPEDAARSGAAHLASGFVGTDTVSAADYVEDYYFADSDKEFVAATVPATEHAVSSTNILVRERELRLASDGIIDDVQVRMIAERNFMRDLITINHPKGIVSYVADTYDYWAVIRSIVPSLKDVIMAREKDANGLAKLVIRPDSGDPVEIICGLRWQRIDNLRSFVLEADTEVIDYKDKFYRFHLVDGVKDYIELDEEVPDYIVKGSIECLWDTFGGTITSTGHRLLDEHIGLIYGDSITLKRAEAILEGLNQKGFASGNVVFGIGSYTYQMNTRDTFGTAMKATAAVVNDDFIEVFKDPKTGNALKKSAKGLLRVTEENGEYVLHDQQKWDEMHGADNLLREVWRDGKWLITTSLAEIRERLSII